MHTLQKLLIKRLVEENGRVYSSLTRGYDSEDNIAFHLKQLLADELVEKREEKYFITAKGINKLNEFQKTDLKDNTFKMCFVGFVCKCGDEYLIKPHKNAMEVFYNLPSGSPLFGEDLTDALPRIFYDETVINLKYEDFNFDSFHMKTVKSADGDVLFDDAFVVFLVDVTSEQKEKMVMKKGCEWQRKESLEQLKNKWPETDFCILRENWGIYKNYTIVSDYILR